MARILILVETIAALLIVVAAALRTVDWMRNRRSRF
jgi:hypothetical protein